MSKHTPTPWEANGFHVHQKGTIITVALMAEGDLVDDDTARANCAHIVHCVNLYDELVEAAENFFDHYSSGLVAASRPVLELHERLESVLAKTKEMK